jgi:Sec-independent protein translocase protein TatA
MAHIVIIFGVVLVIFAADPVPETMEERMNP